MTEFFYTFITHIHIHKIIQRMMRKLIDKRLHKIEKEPQIKNAKQSRLNKRNWPEQLV